MPWELPRVIGKGIAATSGRGKSMRWIGMYIKSVTNNGYKHTETISMQKASDRYKETYRSVPKRMDSLEISSL